MASDCGPGPRSCPGRSRGSVAAGQGELRAAAWGLGQHPAPCTWQRQGRQRQQREQQQCCRFNLQAGQRPTQGGVACLRQAVSQRVLGHQQHCPLHQLAWLPWPGGVFQRAWLLKRWGWARRPVRVWRPGESALQVMGEQGIGSAPVAPQPAAVLSTLGWAADAGRGLREKSLRGAGRGCHKLR
jgi:hypothetical protein